MRRHLKKLSLFSAYAELRAERERNRLGGVCWLAEPALRTCLLERVRGGCTVVLARHQESPLAGLGDQFLWIERGRTAMEGTPDKVLTIYHCDFQLAQ
jgi:hypothetical protein